MPDKKFNIAQEMLNLRADFREALYHLGLMLEAVAEGYLTEKIDSDISEARKFHEKWKGF